MSSNKKELIKSLQNDYRTTKKAAHEYLKSSVAGRLNDIEKLEKELEALDFSEVETNPVKARQVYHKMALISQRLLHARLLHAQENGEKSDMLKDTNGLTQWVNKDEDRKQKYKALWDYYDIAPFNETYKVDPRLVPANIQDLYQEARREYLTTVKPEATVDYNSWDFIPEHKLGSDIEAVFHGGSAFGSLKENKATDRTEIYQDENGFLHITLVENIPGKPQLGGGGMQSVLKKDEPKKSIADYAEGVVNEFLEEESSELCKDPKFDAIDPQAIIAALTAELPENQPNEDAPLIEKVGYQIRVLLGEVNIGPHQRLQNSIAAIDEKLTPLDEAAKQLKSQEKRLKALSDQKTKGEKPLSPDEDLEHTQLQDLKRNVEQNADNRTRLHHLRASVIVQAVKALPGDVYANAKQYMVDQADVVEIPELNDIRARSGVQDSFNFCLPHKSALKGFFVKQGFNEDNITGFGDDLAGSNKQERSVIDLLNNPDGVRFSHLLNIDAATSCMSEGKVGTVAEFQKAKSSLLLYAAQRKREILNEKTLSFEEKIEAFDQYREKICALLNGTDPASIEANLKLLSLSVAMSTFIQDIKALHKENKQTALIVLDRTARYLNNIALYNKDPNKPDEAAFKKLQSDFEKDIKQLMEAKGASQTLRNVGFAALAVSAAFVVAAVALVLLQQYQVIALAAPYLSIAIGGGVGSAVVFAGTTAGFQSGLFKQAPVQPKVGTQKVAEEAQKVYGPKLGGTTEN